MPPGERDMTFTPNKKKCSLLYFIPKILKKRLISGCQINRADLDQAIALGIIDLKNAALMKPTQSSSFYSASRYKELSFFIY